MLLCLPSILPASFAPLISTSLGLHFASAFTSAEDPLDPHFLHQVQQRIQAAKQTDCRIDLTQFIARYIEYYALNTDSFSWRAARNRRAQLNASLSLFCDPGTFKRTIRRAERINYALRA
jgi:hypothetical protein